MAESLTRTYTYTAVSDTGARISDKMAAATPEEVVETLQRAGYLPLSVSETRRFSLRGMGSAVFERITRRTASLKASELSALTSQFHYLLKAGIAAPQAVLTLAEGESREEIAAMLREIADRMVNGVPVSEAFTGYPRCFDEVFLAYMAAGEQTGNMTETTKRLSEVIGKRAEIRRKLVEVSFYPLLVSSFIVLMLAAIILFLVPRYATIYSSFGSELPGPTRAVVSLSKIFPIVAFLIAAAVVAFVSFNRSKRDDLELGTRIDRLRFRLPLFGRLLHLLCLYRWATTVGGSIAAGVPPHVALELGGRASASRWVRASTVSFQQALLEGRPLSTEMSKYPDLYPPTVRRMVATGEETGELSEMLVNVSEALGNDTDLIVATMGAKLEVALLVFMAISVGSILIALYLPILRLTDAVGGQLGGS